jgi:hypothetical protein
MPAAPAPVAKVLLCNLFFYIPKLKPPQYGGFFMAILWVIQEVWVVGAAAVEAIHRTYR